MRASYPIFEFKEKGMRLAGTAIIIVVLLGANVMTTNAQQQERQQPSTNQPTTTSSSLTQNRTATARQTVFESTRDGFRVALPEGWMIQDVNNTAFTLAAEALQGYGVLAQLCPDGDEVQQQGADADSTNGNSSCQPQPHEEIIYIIRYPNLDNRLGITVADITRRIPDSILEYEIQKLHEVGYRDINIVNARNVRIGVNYTTTEDAPSPRVTLPARLAEITYSTGSAPGEMRRGYLIITATNVTPPGLETITGYSIFYEGATGAEQTAAPGNLTRASLPPPLRQVFGSFELIASDEALPSILGLIAQQAADNEPDDQVEEDGPGGGEEGGEEEEEEGEE